MFLTGFISLSFLLLFPLPIVSFIFTVFNSISANIDEVLSINPTANAFVFGDFNVYHKGWVNYSGGTFLFQMTLLRWLTFLLGFLTVALTVLLFWICFSLLMLVFVVQWLSLHWEILVMLLSQFPLTFCQTQTGCPVSLYSL